MLSGRKLTGFIVFSAIVFLVLFINCTGANADNEGTTQTPALSTLELGSCTLSPSFAADITSYTTSVTNDITNITVTSTPTQNDSIITVNGNVVPSGQASEPIGLNVGMNTVTIEVSLADNPAKTIYTVAVTRAGSPYLTALTAKIGRLAVPMSPKFNKTMLQYSVNVSKDISSVNIFPTAEDSGNATIKVNNNTVVSGQRFTVQLSPGDNYVHVVVTSSIGSDHREYIIKITKARSAFLSSLAISSGTLAPAYLSVKSSYTAKVGSDVTSIALTPVAEDSSASIKVNGLPVASGQESDPVYLNFGLNPVSIQVTSSQGDTNTYTVSITRETSPYLLELSTSVGVPGPEFVKSIYSYTVNAGYDVSNIALTPVAEDTDAAITVNGEPVASGRMSGAINLNEGANTILVQVTPKIGTPVAYTITVIRAASPFLTSLTLKAGRLIIPVSPVFDSKVFEYNADVNKDTMTVNIYPVVENNTINTIKVNNTIVANGQYASVTVNPGVNNIIVTVEPAADSDRKTYVIKVTRPESASLSNLAISSGTLAPAFSSLSSSYTVNVEHGISSIILTPTAEVDNAGITVNGETVASRQPTAPINLNVGTNTITIEVTSENGLVKMTYVITVIRAGNACLSGLSINGGVLAPAFAKSNFSYTANVGYDVSSITVTPIAEQTDAVVKVNGVTVINGQSSPPVNLDVGSNTITVEVASAADQAGTTYTIKVTRASSPYLSALVLSSGTDITITPAFAKITFCYTANVSFYKSGITITPTAEDNNATILVNDTTVTSGQPSVPISLAVGQNTITVKVIPVKGDIAEYIINVKRKYDLPGLPNIALYKATSASSSVGSYLPSMAVDGNYEDFENRWMCTQLPGWLCVDLGSSVYFNRWVVQNLQSSGWPQNYNMKAYSLQVSEDMSNWTTVDNTITNNSASVTDKTIPLTRGRYARVYIDTEGGLPANPNYAAIAEFELYQMPTPNTLSMLSLSANGSNVPLTPAFSSPIITYTSSVPFEAASILVTPTATESHSTIKVGSTTVISGQPISVPLVTGANTIQVVVTPLFGYPLTYTINVTRAHSAYLSGLTLQSGSTTVPLTPGFGKTTNAYTASVGASITSVNVCPTAEDPSATITVNGTSVASGGSVPVNINIGTNTINVIVSASGVTQQNYTITVTKDDLYLSAIQIKAGKATVTLAPAFDKTQTSYAGSSVKVTVFSVTVTAEAPDGVTLKVNNIPATSGVQLNNVPTTLGAMNHVIIIVTSKTTGATMTYNVNTIVEGSPRLSNLALQSSTTNIPLSPSFGKDTTTYAASTDFTTASVTVIPTAESPDAAITVNGTKVTSEQSIDVVLNRGMNTISVVVTSPYGTPTTYTINVARAHSTYLSNLTLQSGTTNIPIAPGFSKTINAYTASVGASITSVTVTPTAEDSGASITVNGTPVASGGSVPVNVNLGTNNISVVVSANGVTQQTYTITVSRQTDLYLSNLVIKFGKAIISLTPPFNKTQTSYTSSSARATSLYVTATAEAPTDVTLTINNVTATSGTLVSVPVIPGAVNAINVVVTSITTGATMTYTCNITVAS